VVPCDPAIELLGISQKKLETYIHTKAHKWIFTMALFINATFGSNQDVMQ
jgi:hypothetical protein